MRRPNARAPAADSSSSTDTTETKPMKKLQIGPTINPNSPAKEAPRTWRSWAVVGLVPIVLVSALGYFLTRNFRASDGQRYGIVIDGGSTGTRIHVFGYRIEDGEAVFDFGEDGLASMRATPGLSAFAEDPEAAGGSLEELIGFAKRRVPREFWPETEARLMATAGMRLLESSVQERILASCRRELSGSGFKFREDWASIITGPEEGMYAWVIANYALDTLGGDPSQTTGIIELGGASTQVTFVSSEQVPPEFLRRVKYGNYTYNLYSHSLLHFGQNVAFDSLRESIVSENSGSDVATGSPQKGISIDPCTPKGYLHDIETSRHLPVTYAAKKKYLSSLQSVGNFSECRSAAQILLRKGQENCSYDHCYVGSSFIPRLQGNFLATENFFHTSKFFGLGPKTSLSDLMKAGQEFCGEDWSSLREKYHLLDEEALLPYCFSSAYIVALLHDSLGIAMDDERIGYTNRVENIPLDWALGAFILQSTSDINNNKLLPSWVTDDSPRLLSVIGFSIILVFTAWSVLKWRKPQFKTVYDLEKGRYIITRVNRS